MTDTLQKLHSEIDEKLSGVLSLCEKFGRNMPFAKEPYFAADVIAQHYNGKYLSGLACACQCFFASRMLHLEKAHLSSEAVLLGDLFIGQMSQFELPDDFYQILERFAAFVATETEQMEKDAAVTPDLAQYEQLFVAVAEGMHE